MLEKKPLLVPFCAIYLWYFKYLTNYAICCWTIYSFDNLLKYPFDIYNLVQIKDQNFDSAELDH